MNPDSYITRFGSDVFRVYLMFMGPYQAGGDFSDRGIGGAVRFLDRVWSLVTQHAQNASAQAPQGGERRVIHRLIKRVTKDLATLKYNTAVAALMGYLNALEARSTVTRGKTADPAGTPCPNGTLHHRGTLAETQASRPRSLNPCNVVAHLRCARPLGPRQ